VKARTTKTRGILHRWGMQKRSHNNQKIKNKKGLKPLKNKNSSNTPKKKKTFKNKDSSKH
jgi:hypothetical protein